MGAETIVSCRVLTPPKNWPPVPPPLYLVGGPPPPPQQKGEEGWTSCHPLRSDNISFLRNPHPPQSGRHNCITPDYIPLFSHSLQIIHELRIYSQMFHFYNLWHQITAPFSFPKGYLLPKQNIRITTEKDLTYCFHLTDPFYGIRGQ